MQRILQPGDIESLDHTSFPRVLLPQLPALFVERAANGNAVNRITYATDRSGLRTGVTEQGTFANRTISYQYDALRRLGRETRREHDEDSRHPYRRRSCRQELARVLRF